MEGIRHRRSAEAAGDLNQKHIPYADIGSLVPDYINGVPSYSGNIKLYLQCNGVDGSHTFPDLSANKHVVTSVNNAQVDTAIKKFGTGSVLFPANTDYLSIPAHSSFDYGANPFTIQLQIYFLTVANGYIYNQYVLATGAETSLFYETNKLHFLNWDGTNWGIWIECAWTPSANTWYHIEIDRKGSDWFIFVAGISKALTKTQGAWANALYAVNAPLFFNHSVSNGIVGHYDEIRINDQALHTANFTPPSKEVSP